MSNWLGRIDERIVAHVTIKSYIWRPAWGTRMKLYLMEDKFGNLLTFRSPAKFTIGGKWRLDGTVKRHHEFHGQKQTHISNWGLMCGDSR